MERIKKISIVSPALNEAKNIPLLCDRIKKVFSEFNYDFEIIIADNGSSDNTLEVIEDLQKTTPQLKVVKLTRNFGHQGGLFAGLDHATGDAVITMDADLQHPPEIIKLMLQKWEMGYKVVNTEKQKNQSTLLRKIVDKSFYYGMNRFVGLEIGHGDFRLLDKEVLLQFRSLPETEKFMRGLISWFGYKTDVIQYVVADRAHGVSKFNGKQLWDLALNGITSFSFGPLRFIFKLGIFIFVPSFLYLIYVLAQLTLDYIFHWGYVLPPGWATISVAVIFFGSVQMLFLGILGEYVGRIYSEVKRRPKYIVKNS